MKLEAFGSSYFHGKIRLEDNGTQIYLVFRPFYKDFKKIANRDHILAWKSKGLSDESIKPAISSKNRLQH